MNFAKYLPKEFCEWLEFYIESASDITLIEGGNMFITENGKNIKSDLYISKDIFNQIINKITKGSIYANQHTLKDGYITLPEGHRVGVTGTLNTNEQGLCYLTEITAINIRISRYIPGAGDKIVPHIVNDNRIYNTLIIAPPSTGKTTILRDLAIRLGKKHRIGIIDERSEIAVENAGNYVFTVKGTTKYQGILMLLRSMAPQVVLTDEIGTEDDEVAVKKLINAGVKMICTAHGYDEEDIMRRKALKSIIDTGAFERLIVLSGRLGPGTVEKIINTQEHNIND